MMNLNTKPVDIPLMTDVFITLGRFLRQFSPAGFSEDKELGEINRKFEVRFEDAIRLAEIHNPWFTAEFIRHAFMSLSFSLTGNKIHEWMSAYPELGSLNGTPKKIGIIMAGNIPLVGFHDLISTMFTGHEVLGKMSSKDQILYPVIKDLLCFLNPYFGQKIILSAEPLKDIDAIIATGSNNSARYFEYYFRKYPHIIRKNRNSAAIIHGSETKEQLKKLGDDIFLYFGLGCRNVSKIFLPAGYDPVMLLSSFENYSYLYHHNKYANNYQYHKAIFLVDKIHHLDTGFLLFREDKAYASPVGVLYFEFFGSEPEMRNRISNDHELLQCVVESDRHIPGSVPFGKSQLPELWDYADHIDTIEFLIKLYKK
jgi:hypothetical protein